MQKNEIRITPRCCSIRETAPDKDGNKPDSRTIEGYAIVFNEESVVLDDWGVQFREIIAPEACTQEYINGCDIKMTLFHDRQLLLARYMPGRDNNSLRLFVDALGVRFEFEAPTTADGEKALQGVARGDLSGCSFTFAPDKYTTEERADGSLLITHHRFAWLGEMTIGSDPAYTQTTVNCREVTENMPSAVNKREAEARERATAVRNHYLSGDYE